MIQTAIDPVLDWTLRLFLAAVFARALYGKLRSPGHFVEAVRGYALLPDRLFLTSLAAVGLLALEAAVVVGILVPGPARTAALLAAALLVLYTLAIGVNLARGRRDIDCGCAGPLQRAGLHEWLLVRNGVYTAMALAAALPALGTLPESARPLVWLDAATIALAVLSLSALALALDALSAHAPALQHRVVTE